MSIDQSSHAIRTKMITYITMIDNDDTYQDNSSNTRMSAADYSRVAANGEPLNRISGGRTAQGNEFPWFDFHIVESTTSNCGIRNIQSYKINH